MTESFNIYAAKVNIDIEYNTVEVSGFDLSQLVAEFSVEEVFEALVGNDQFSTLADLVAEELNKTDE